MRQASDRPGRVLLVGVDGFTLGWGDTERDAATNAFHDLLAQARRDPEAYGSAAQVLEILAEAEFVYVVSKSSPHVEAFLRGNSKVFELEGV
jgi:hypothetical protein